MSGQSLPSSSASGRLALFDPQVNGFAGVDFQQENIGIEQMRDVARALARHQTGAIYLTLITDEIDALCRKLRAFEKFRAEDPQIAAMIPGYHLEGPYLSPKPGFHGAHPAEKMKAPDEEEFARLQEAAGGNIRLLTLAPEWEGSGAFIEKTVAEGVIISIGHSDASEADIDRAAAAGASLCTHLGNGTPGEMHRFENVVHRLLSRDDLPACFIPDGIHIPPFALKNLVRAKPRGKVLYTTDCMAAAGAPVGRYTLGGLEIEVGADRVVREPGKTNFAGSALAPDEAAANFARFTDYSEEESWEIGSSAAGKFFGVSLPTLGDLSQQYNL